MSNDSVNGTSIGDSGNAFDSANVIPGNSNSSSITGGVGGTDSYDFYKFVATASGTATFSLNGLSQDHDLYLFSGPSSSSYVTGSNNTGLNSEFFSYSITAGNTYYILVNPTTGVSNYNLNVTLPTGASTTPDLVVSSISAPASVAQGANLAFSYVAKNQGGGTTGTHYAGISVDQQPSESTFLTYNSVGALSAAGVQTLTNSISTTGLSVGTHTLYIKEDFYGNSVTESDETNNVRSVTFNVTGSTASTPDVVVSSISAPASVAQGTNLAFSYVAKNQGGGTTGTHYAGISVDQQPSESTFLTYNSVGALSAAGVQTLTNSISTTGLSVGTHTLYIKEDFYGNSVTESDETNNVRSVTFNVTGSTASTPDVVVSSISAPASVAQGTNLAFSYVAKNQGGGTTGTHYAGISVDQQPSESTFLTYNSVGALSAAGVQTLTNSISTTGLSVGTHTLYIKEDFYGNSVTESDETNNVRSVTFNVTGSTASTPDVVVSSISAPASVAQGTNLAFSYVAKNQGGGTTGTHYAGISVDQQPSESTFLTYNSVGALSAAGVQTLTNSISTTGLSVGTHTLYIKEDFYGNSVTESDETNNVRSVTFNVTGSTASTPDVVVSSISAPASVAQGTNLAFSYVAKNQGGGTTGTHYAGISVDQQPSESTFLTYNSVGALSAAGVQTLTNSISTTGLSVGTHTLYIKEDFYGNSVTESDETNNVRSVTFNVTGSTASTPDVVVSSISAPASVAQGTNLAFSYVAKNQGGGTTGTHYAGISVDQQPSESTFLTYNSVGALSAAGVQTLTNSISTTGLSVGTHTLYIKEDFYGNSVTESDETNNVRSVTFNVTGSTASTPDVVVSSISAPASVAQGTNLAFSYVAKNQGGGTTGTHYAGISVDQQPSESTFLTYNSVGALSAAGVQTLTNSISTTGLSVGTHTLYIKEDFYGNSVTESDETNNVRSVTFNVTGSTASTPDVVVSSISAPASVAQGTNLAFSYVAKNQGGGTTGTHYAGISVDQQPSESTFLTYNSVGALSAAGVQTLTNSISTTGLSVGTHTLYIKEDFYGNSVTESDETNNVRSVTFNVTGGTATTPDFFIANAVSVEDWLPDGVNNIPENSSLVKNNELCFTLFLSQDATKNYSFQYQIEIPTSSIGSVNPASLSDFVNPISTGVVQIAQGSRTAQIKFTVNGDNIKEAVEYAKLSINLQGDGNKKSANGYIIDNDFSINNVQSIYSSNTTNGYDFALKNYYNSSTHTGVDVNSTTGTTSETNLPSPSFGVVTKIAGISTSSSAGNISVLMPSLFSPNDENYYITFLHSTRSDLASGSLLEPGTILGDFNPPAYSNHMHIEVKNNQGYYNGWVSTSGSGTTVATDNTNIARLAAADVADPKPFIAIAQNMNSWQDSSGVIPLGAFGVGSNHVSGAFSYMDGLGVSDSSDDLKFFLTERKEIAVRVVWNNDGDVNRELDFSIGSIAATTSDSGAGQWSPAGGQAAVDSGEYMRKTFTLDPGEYTIKIVGDSSIGANLAYWLNFSL
jgi:subtilase family serine protease